MTYFTYAHTALKAKYVSRLFYKFILPAVHVLVEFIH